MTTIKRILFIFCFLCSSFPVVNAENKVAQDDQTLPHEDPASAKFITIYKGTLRCADCPGIRTEIRLNSHNLLYRETDTYLERNVMREMKGTYNTERGYKKKRNATVYVLDDDKPGQERRFLKLDENTLLMLGTNGEIIGKDKSFKLFKAK
jgi:hypothetical protein